MNIRFLGAHNSETRTTSCACLLIDDTLAIDAGGLTSNLSLDEQQKLRAVLITHQHYDHIRDIPAIALNLAQQADNIRIYATAQVQAAIETYWLNGRIYPKFQELPASRPSIIFRSVMPYAPRRIDGHGFMAIPVKHTEPTVGY